MHSVSLWAVLEKAGIIFQTHLSRMNQTHSKEIRPKNQLVGDQQGLQRAEEDSAFLTNYSLMEIQTALISGYQTLAICYLAFKNMDNVPLKLKWAAETAVPTCENFSLIV